MKVMLQWKCVFQLLIMFTGHVAHVHGSLSKKMKQSNFTNNARFPINQVFGVPSNTPGLEVYQCHSTVTSSQDKRCCECGDDCMMYGTCCIDYLWNNEAHLPLNDYFSLFLRHSEHFNKTKPVCQTLLPLEENRNHSIGSFYMISSCPTNSVGSNQCTSISTVDKMIAVFGKDGFVYRNKYCALCNQVKDFKYIDLVGKCVDASNISHKYIVNVSDLLHLKECIFEPSGGMKNKMKSCVKQKCSSNDKNYALCNAYQGYLASGKFNNFHCYICSNKSANTSSITDLIGCPKTHCERNKCALLPDGKEYSKYIYVFTLQFNNGIGSVTVQNYKQKFPIRKFLDIPNDYEFPKDVGLDSYMCNSTRNVDRCCECGGNCMEHKRCCIDAFWNETNPIPYDDYINSFLSKSRNIPTYICDYVYPLFDSTIQDSEMLFMVKSCPLATNIDVKTSCLDSKASPLPIRNVPVIGRNGVLYANMFCAICNNVFQYSYALLKLQCNDVDEETGAETNTTELRKKITTESLGCTYIFAEENNFTSAERCYIRFDTLTAVHYGTRQCSSNNLNYDLCNSYLGEIAWRENYHCFKCNSEYDLWQPFIGYCDNTDCRPLCKIKTITTTMQPSSTSSFQTTRTYTETTWPTSRPVKTTKRTTQSSENTKIRTTTPYTTPPFYTTPTPFYTTRTYRTTIRYTDTPKPTKVTKSVSMLLDFTKFRQIIFIDGKEPLYSECPKGTAWNKKGICEKYSCGTAYQISSSSCVYNGINKKTFSINVENATFEKCLLARGTKLYAIVHNKNFDTTNYSQKLSRVFQHTFLDTNATFKTLINDTAYIRNKIDVRSKIRVLQLNIPITFSMLKNLSQELQEENSILWNFHKSADNTQVEYVATSSIKWSTTLYPFQLERNFPNKLCNIYEELTSNNLNFTEDCGIFFNNQTIPTENLSMWINFKESKKGISHCELFHLHKPCYRRVISENITLDKSTYNITVQTGRNKTVTYSPSEYEPVSDGFSICIPKPDIQYVSNRYLNILSNIEEKFTVIGISLSIVCYVWIIATYLLVDSLKTLPGYCYVFMCGCLLLSDCMFIVSVQLDVNKVECISLAILMHWSLLCSFMWTIVIAFDLLSRFNSFSNHTNEDPIKRVKRRCYLTFSIPTACVVILVILDQTDAVDIQYAVRNCWIGNLYARIAFYIIPVAAISLSTLLVLIYTILKIRKEQKKNESVLGTKRRSNLLRIALKLVIILGITELFGYVQLRVAKPTVNEMIFNAIFKFVYTVTRSLRGVMLWIVLVFGGNILEKYQKNFTTFFRNHKFGYRQRSNLSTPSSSVHTMSVELKNTVKFDEKIL